MKEIKYGQFMSEKNSEQYKNIHHFHVVFERDGFHIATGFTNYGYSCFFQAVTIHTHSEEKDCVCEYSPTGFCSWWESKKASNYFQDISDKMAVNILIERLEKSLNSEDSGLMWQDKEEMYNELNNFQIWDDD